jgi:hypothetical protein
MSIQVGSLRQITEPEKVKKIYWYKHGYLVVLDRKAQVPSEALELPFKVEEVKIPICPICGSRLEIDADEYFCPRHGEIYPKTASRKRIILTIDENTIIEQIAEKLTGKKWRLVEKLYYSLAGGFYPNFKINDVEILIPLPSSNGRISVETISGYAIVQNPSFEESHWDESSTQTKTYEGEYLVLDIMGKGYYILKGER